MLTELETWEAVAEKWEHAWVPPNGEACVSATSLVLGRAYGLCDTILSLVREGLVDTPVSVECYKAINEYRKKSGIGTAFLWPLTKEGASARSAFCRHQAALIREKTQAKEKDHA